MEAALTGHYQAEHLFALSQSLELYDFYQAKIAECDQAIEAALARLDPVGSTSPGALPKARRRSRQSNEPAFDVRNALFAPLGTDLTQMEGFGPYSILRLIGECGTDMSRFPTARHFASWLTLSPGNKVSGGKVLSTRTRRSSNRAAAVFRLAAVNVGRTQTAMEAFYRRLSARVGKAKAVTATARKLAVPFYNALRYGMDYKDPGVAYYEEQHRQRVLKGLRRRAHELGYQLSVPGTTAEVS